MDECVFPKICRTCLNDEGDMKSVFVPDEASGYSIHLSEMIMSFASVQITFGDGLPEFICTQCADKAVGMYLFKRKCEEVDSLLRQRLGRSPFREISDENDDKINDNEKELHYDADSTVKSDQSPESNSEDEKQNLKYLDEETDQERSNEENLSLKCNLCSKHFTSQLLLNRHIKTHSAIKQFECDACNKRFSRKDLLLRHKIAHAMKMDDGKMDFSNFQNDYEEIDNSFEDDTIIIKTEADLYPCSECNLIFIKKEEFDSHLKEHKTSAEVNTKLSCKVCSKKFTKQSHLNRHLRTHSDNKPNVCPTCKKGFSRPEQLTNHMNVHSGIKPHTCDICFKGFNQISNLKDHMRTHNGEKPFLCSTCGKGFNQLGNLRQHTIRHSGVKAHLCSTCGNGFASKGELSAHLRKHTGARPFVCPICNHGFTTSSSLTKHKRIHSGEKPYECDVCKMKFSRSGILARHKRTHTGEKPYVCKFCSKAFSQSNDLTSHLRIHTGEKPYICDACGQAFRQSSALKTHKKTHIDKNKIDSRSLVLHSTTAFVGKLHSSHM